MCLMSLVVTVKSRRVNIFTSLCDFKSFNVKPKNKNLIKTKINVFIISVMEQKVRLYDHYQFSEFCMWCQRKEQINVRRSHSCRGRLDQSTCVGGKYSSAVNRSFSWEVLNSWSRGCFLR